MKILLSIIIAALFIQPIYSQTEYDYHENLRLERKENKIKVIKRIYKTNDYSYETMDYYDEEGYLVKRCYNRNGNISCPHIVTEHHQNGDITVQSDLGEEGMWTTTGSQSLFYLTSFGIYDLRNKVELMFDENSRLIEKRIYGGHLYDEKDYESMFAQSKYYW